MEKGRHKGMDEKGDDTAQMNENKACNRTQHNACTHERQSSVRRKRASREAMEYGVNRRSAGKAGRRNAAIRRKPIGIMELEMGPRCKSHLRQRCSREGLSKSHLRQSHLRVDKIKSHRAPWQVSSGLKAN